MHSYSSNIIFHIKYYESYELLSTRVLVIYKCAYYS